MTRCCRRHPEQELRLDINSVPRLCKQCALDDKRELPRVVLPGYVQAIAVLSNEAEQVRRLP